MKQILIVEDTITIAQGIKSALVNENYQIDIAYDGKEGYDKAINGNYDLIILDLVLPQKNGIEICRDMRLNRKNTPIIILTSKKDESDKILGLELGADDYLTKPFSIKELIARIHAVLRRYNNELKDKSEYCFGDIEINFMQMEVLKKGIPIKLSSTEFKILKYFSLHEGEVITRDRFLDDVWGYDSFPVTRTVDNYILSLRKKIEDNPAEPVHLITIYNAGYKFIKG